MKKATAGLHLIIQNPFMKEMTQSGWKSTTNSKKASGCCNWLAQYGEYAVRVFHDENKTK